MRWEYAKSWKMLAVVLNQICAVVLVLSVAVCTFFAGSRGFSWVGSDESFESTAYYQSEVLEQIYRCIRAASRESKFEKDGVYADISIKVDSGYIVPEVAFKIQQSVKHNVEAMTKYKVAKVDVYVVGVEFSEEHAAEQN